MSKAEFFSIIGYDLLGAALFYIPAGLILYAFIRWTLVMVAIMFGLMALSGWLIYALLFWPKGFYLY